MTNRQQRDIIPPNKSSFGSAPSSFFAHWLLWKSGGPSSHSRSPLYNVRSCQLTVLSLQDACTLNCGGKVTDNVSGPSCVSNSSSGSSVQQTAVDCLSLGNIRGQEIKRADPDISSQQRMWSGSCSLTYVL